MPQKQQGDRLSATQRSELMAKVRGKNTKPELILRSELHKRGYRYRLHSSDLPGSPDIVFSSRRKVIFVHGCFWHRHEQCKLSTTPTSRQEFWTKKFSANIARDKKNVHLLEEAGWNVMVVWQCELKDLDNVMARVVKFLNN